MKTKAQQKELPIDDAFRLVGERTEDGDRVARETAAEDRRRADFAARQPSLFDAPLVAAMPSSQSVPATPRRQPGRRA